MEIKHQGKSILQHPELLAIESFSTPHYTEKIGGLMPPPDANSKPAWKTFGRQMASASNTRYSPSHSWDKPA
jgi:hypothetical protein